MRRDRRTGKLIARRIQMILMRGSGLSQEAVAGHLKVNRPVVSHWEKRFREMGLAGLSDAEGRGRKPSLSAEKRALIENGQTHNPFGERQWSVRKMAEHAGVAIGTVHSIWKAQRVQPQVEGRAGIAATKTNLKLGWSIIGLYLRPPTKVLAIVEFVSDDEALFQQGSSTTRDLNPPSVPERNLASFLSALSYIERKVFSQLAPRSDERPLREFLKGAMRLRGNVKCILLANKSLPDLGSVSCVVKLAGKCSWMEQVESYLRQTVERAHGPGLNSEVSEIVFEMEKWVDRASVESQSFCWMKSVYVDGQ